MIMPEKRILPPFDSKSGINNVYVPFFCNCEKTIEIIYIKMTVLLGLIRNLSEMWPCKTLYYFLKS